MAIGKQCERCGTENPATNNFCGNCGSALPALPVPVAEDPQASTSNDQSADQTPTTSSPAGPFAASGEMPNVPPRSPQRPTSDDLPEWLRDLNAFQQEQPQPLPLPASSRQSDSEAPTEVVAATQNELPAWLHADIDDLPAESASTPTGDVPALPAWLVNDPDRDNATAGRSGTERGRPADQTGLASNASDNVATPESEADIGLPSWLIATPASAPNATPEGQTKRSAPFQRRSKFKLATLATRRRRRRR